MVKVYDANGKVLFEEPPYTEEEQMEMYRRMSMRPGSSFTRPSGQAAPQAAGKQPRRLSPKKP